MAYEGGRMGWSSIGWDGMRWDGVENKWGVILLILRIEKSYI